METYGIMKLEVADVPPDEVVRLQHEIDMLINRIRLLNRRLPACKFKHDEMVKIYNPEVDEKMLKIAKRTKNPNLYVGKGYRLEVVGNKRKFIPVYFTQADGVKFYAKD